MQKTQSVTNDLYRIKDQLAGAVPLQTSANQWGKSTPTRENNPPVPESRTVPQNRDTGIAPELLKRRYNEFQRMRNDLLERINTMAGMLQQEAETYNSRLAVLQRTADDLNRIQDELPLEEAGKEQFQDRSELAETTLLMERLRIEILRLIPVIESGTSEPARSAGTLGAVSGKNPAGNGSSAETGILLDSLSFRQIFRTSFVAALPLIIGGIAAALIIALAIIGSFNGLF